MKLRVLLASYCALLLLGLAVVGCADFFPSTSTSPGTTGFVYVLNQGSSPGFIGSVSGYGANASTGVLASLLNSPFAPGTQIVNPNGITADPLGRFVFVSNSGGGINGFIISASSSSLGQLSSTGATTVTAKPILAIIEDPKARAVYVLEAGTPDQVEGFAINSSTGALTALSGSPFALPSSSSAAGSLAIDPSGSFLFAGGSPSGGVTGTITTLPIKSDSTLDTANQQMIALNSTFTNAPISMFVDPVAALLYAVNGSQQVFAFTVTSGTGALTAVTGSPFTITNGQAPQRVAIDIRGLFVFTANGGTLNTVSMLSIASSGVPTPVAASPFAVGQTNPVALAVDPSGNFLYVVNNTSPGTVSSFVIVGSGTSGTLTAANPATASTGTNPLGVVAVP